MYKFILLLLAVCSVGTPALKLEMPQCVREFVENYVKDSTGERGFLDIQKTFNRFDKSITSNEIEVDLPIKEYMFDYDKLDTCSDTLPVEELINPTGKWILPVKARGKYIYQVFIRYTITSAINSAYVYSYPFFTIMPK